MRFSLIFLASGVTATNQNFATGQALGAALSEGISGNTQAFQAEMQSVFASQPAVRNSAVEGIFANRGSFLQKRPVLNLHVGETKSTSLDAEAAAARASLAGLEADEARDFGKMAHTSFLESPSDVQRLAAEAASASDVMKFYGDEIAMGGDVAARGFAGALNAAAEPNMKAPLGFLVSKAATLAKKESTPDSLRNLAGSLVTLLTNMPVAFTSTDTEGSNAHTNIIVPAPSRVYGADARGDLYA